MGLLKISKYLNYICDSFPCLLTMKECAVHIYYNQMATAVCFTHTIIQITKQVHFNVYIKPNKWISGQGKDVRQS